MPSLSDLPPPQYRKPAYRKLDASLKGVGGIKGRFCELRMEGQTLSEIANVLDMPLSTLKAHLRAWRRSATQRGNEE